MYKTKYYIYKNVSGKYRLLINTLTGDTIYIRPKSNEERYVLLFSKEKYDLISNHFLEILKEKYFIYNSKEEEMKKIEDLKEIHNKTKENKPLMFCFCLTYLCNSKCKYCYEEGVEQKCNIMTINDIDKAFEAIKYIISINNTETFNFFIEGGEPFMKGNEKVISHLLKKMEEFKKEYFQTNVFFFTNCTNTNSFIDILLSHKELITEFLITMIGNKELHNLYRPTKDKSEAFENTLKVIDNLIQNKFSVKIILNIDRGNVHGIKDIINVVKKYKWDQSQYFHGYYPSRIKYLTSYNKNEMSEFEVLHTYNIILSSEGHYYDRFNFGDFRCLKNVLNFIQSLSSKNPTFQQFESCSAATLKQFIFDANGDIYTCTKVTGKIEYSIGKYSPYLLLDEEKIKWWKNRNSANISKCKSCFAAFVCGGNCVYEAIEKNGDANNPVCPPVMQLIDYSLCPSEPKIIIKNFVN